LRLLNESHATTPRSTTNPTSINPMNESATVSKRVRRMFGLSLLGWENAMISFLIIAGFFALVAGVATWVVVRLQRVEIAESNARQAEAELKLAEVREKLGRPREIDFDKFIARLAGVPKLPVVVSYADGDPDSFWLAGQIASALEKAKWQATLSFEMPREAKLCSGKIGGIAVLSKTMSNEEAEGLSKPPKERGTPFLALADALWNSVGENSTGFATCPFLTDGILHVAVWPRWVIFPKEKPAPHP
jgi:hypothetical protein